MKSFVSSSPSVKWASFRSKSSWLRLNFSKYLKLWGFIESWASSEHLAASRVLSSMHILNVCLHLRSPICFSLTPEKTPLHPPQQTGSIFVYRCGQEAVCSFLCNDRVVQGAWQDQQTAEYTVSKRNIKYLWQHLRGLSRAAGDGTAQVEMRLRNVWMISVFTRVVVAGAINRVKRPFTATQRRVIICLQAGKKRTAGI